MTFVNTNPKEAGRRGGSAKSEAKRKANRINPLKHGKYSENKSLPRCSRCEILWCRHRNKDSQCSHVIIKLNQKVNDCVTNKDYAIHHMLSYFLQLEEDFERLSPLAKLKYVSKMMEILELLHYNKAYQKDNIEEGLNEYMKFFEQKK